MSEARAELERRMRAAYESGDMETARKIAFALKGADEGPSDLTKYGPGFVRESLGNVARGAEGVSSVLEKAPHPIMMGVRALSNAVGVPKVKAPEPGAPADDLWRRVTEGAGAGAVVGGPLIGGVRGLYSGAVSGAAGAAGSAAGESLADQLDPKGENSWVKPVMSLVGGLAGSAPAAFLTGPRQTLAQRELRDAQKGLTPADYAEMQRKLVQARAAGSDTYMLADAQPKNSPLQTLTSKYGSMEIHNPLRENLARRPEDLQRLGEETVRRAAGTTAPVSPAQTALTLENSAARALDNLDELRGTALTNRLAGRVLPQSQFDDVEQSLLAWGQNQPRTTAQEAARKVLEQLRAPDGQPIRDLQQLSLAIKELKATAPGIEAASGQKITSNDLRRAITVAETALARNSKAFREGMADFRAFSENVRAPAKQGPIGAVADKRPYVDDPAPVGGLNRITAGQTPADVERAGRTLRDPNLTQQQPINPREIVAAIIQQRLNKGSVNPGATVRGMAGSREEQNLAALLRAGGANPQQVLAPLNVADDMQNLTNLGLQGPPEMRWWQAGLRPFRTADMMITQQGEAKAAEEIARIMASRDPAAIRQLQEIAMFQPGLRRLMSLYSGAIPQATQE